MTFGRKGLAPGQVAAAAGPGGFGRAPAPHAAPQAPAPQAVEAPADDIAAKREAFIASERARAAGLGADAPAADAPHDPLINLRNMHPTPRPAKPMPEEPVGASGMTASQEAAIRAAGRGMARNQAPRSTSYGGGSTSPRTGKKYIFGDPQSRSVGMAYLIWFVIGQTGMHRVYCGRAESALYQVGLLIGSVIAALIFLPFAFGIIIWMFWIFADLFLIPGMMRRFKEETNQSAVFE